MNPKVASESGYHSLVIENFHFHQIVEKRSLSVYAFQYVCISGNRLLMFGAGGPTAGKVAKVVTGRNDGLRSRVED